MKVSIITTSFNSESTISDTLNSVKGQSYSNIEHIIIDGKSKDSTVAIASAFDHVQAIISERDNGIYDAMNKGLEKASGEIIGILNSDDIYAHDEVISEVVDVMIKGDVDTVYGDLIYKDQKLEKVKRKWNAGIFDPKKFEWGWMPPHPTFFVKKYIYDNYGQFRLDLGSAADYELMLRFLYKHRVTSSYINDVLVFMRTGGASNASWMDRIKANKIDAEAWKINKLSPKWYTRWLKPARKIGQWL